MRYSSKPVKAVFKKRLNRFLGVVEIDGKDVKCFIPNPGRMRELLRTGSIVYLIEKNVSNRKTCYDLILVEYESYLVSVDSRVPNIVFNEAVESSMIPEFEDYVVTKKEPMFLNSRLDFLLNASSKNPVLMEVKSCTLVQNGVALFPDAPTKRGVRHVNDLIQAIPEQRAAIFFLIQREDARLFKPNKITDPSFANALENAKKIGLEVYAYNCLVTLYEILLNERLPVNY